MRRRIEYGSRKSRRMVVKMMRWRPWPPLVSKKPPLLSKKFEVKLVLLRLEGFPRPEEGIEDEKRPQQTETGGLVVEVQWKGPKAALSYLRRTLRKNCTKEEDLRSNGTVVWNEEFQNVCTLSAYKEGVFHPWEIALTVLNVNCRIQVRIFLSLIHVLAIDDI
ncbi:hypothetical protein ACLOJK_040862 [Asimina triloba]